MSLPRNNVNFKNKIFEIYVIIYDIERISYVILGERNCMYTTVLLFVNGIAQTPI